MEPKDWLQSIQLILSSQQVLPLICADQFSGAEQHRGLVLDCLVGRCAEFRCMCILIKSCDYCAGVAAAIANGVEQFELAQPAIVFFDALPPILIKGNVLSQAECDYVAETSYELVTKSRHQFDRKGKGQEGEGVAYGYRWCGQDGYQS